MESEHVIADRAYDSNQFRESIIGNGAIAVIPPRSNRRKPHSYDEYLYRELLCTNCPPLTISLDSAQKVWAQEFSSTPTL